MSITQKTTKICAINIAKPNQGKTKPKPRVNKGERNAIRKDKKIELINKSNKDSTDGSLIPKTIKIIGMTPESCTSGRELVVETVLDGKTAYINYSVVDLATGNHEELAKFLAEKGHFDLCRNPMLKNVAAELLHRGASSKVKVLSSNGYNKLEIDGESYSCYVWGLETHWFGSAPTTKVIVAQSQSLKKPSCSLKEWKKSVGAYLHGNPIMIFVHAHSIAAAIRGLFNEPFMLLALVGPSTIGKSTTQGSVQSTIGHPSGVMTMTGTAIGITEEIVKYKDISVSFQDSRQIKDPQIIADLVFNIADSSSYMKSGSKRNNNTATVILSNERHLADMAAGKNIQIDEGVYARLLEIYCNAPYGVFHDLHGCANGKEFADIIENNCQINYGAVWPAWIKALSENWDHVATLHDKWLPKVKEKILKIAGEPTLGRVNDRILDSLSFSAWAGLIASHFNILPLEKNEIIDAFGLVMKEYMSRQSKGSTPLTDQIVSAVRGFLDERSGRFPDLSTFNDDSQNLSVYGYRFDSKSHGELYLFLPHIFSKQFKVDFGNAAYTIIKEAGFLVSTAGQGHQFQTRIPRTKKQKSFIAVKASIRFDQAE